mmetsp:Transcript_19588/g.29053  ORF Transcript_19588/g.29053 Transcript_19588/m.29053 type:complete len:546 (+) Transcript_19588:160-1797(+)|eukprot:CAMPEP_0194216146 /NCGR_PEP_ID=MMETSP0156-20130528/18398_1 /TAXON_ID=33649 /ORGANISM="Thalassionema nitzschioides, Strain L26-B" /LENGTH=545 /DNA_ID=CAMNT_0038944845 /DNA_START=74 /DNA_END=1714 /DNA_ORIENTATION=-
MKILKQVILCPLLSFVMSRWQGISKIRSTKRNVVLRGGSIDDNGDSILSPQIIFPKKWGKMKKGQKRAIILMDRFSDYHGGYLEQVALEVYGVAVVNVLSTYLWGYFCQHYPHLEEPKLMRIPPTDELLKSWQQKLREEGVHRIEAVICESDSGLAEAEKLAFDLGLTKSNGKNEARRNKYLMNEAIRQAAPHLKVVNQKLCKTVEEALEFAKTELGVILPERSVGLPQNTRQASEEQESGLIGRGQHYYFGGLANNVCIVKPKRGAASDSVHLVTSVDDMKEAFAEIIGSTVLGEMKESHGSVLVQEFVVGTEYAVDIVSKNGQHKIAALWKYDKRPANGRAFVYHATELISTFAPNEEAVCDYATSTLDALDLKWGLTHTEIIIGEDGICRLVEVNCRQHNMDFAPLTMACIGYNALDMLLAAYLGNSNSPTSDDGNSASLDWNLLPDRPVTRAFGAMVHIVNHAKGELVDVNEEALSEIRGLDSTLDMEIYDSFLTVGNQIEPTVDIKTDAGWVQLIHDDAETFVKDYQRILELMPLLFSVR